MCIGMVSLSYFENQILTLESLCKTIKLQKPVEKIVNSHCQTEQKLKKQFSEF